jgi:uncharacterized protein (DUF433 family)
MKKQQINENLVPGSKVPITYLLDYFKEGYSISDFLSSYPWIKKRDVENALEEIKKRDFSSKYAL